MNPLNLVLLDSSTPTSHTTEKVCVYTIFLSKYFIAMRNSYFCGISQQGEGRKKSPYSNSDIYT